MFLPQFVFSRYFICIAQQKCLLTVANLSLFSRRRCLQSSSLNCCHVVGYLSAALKACGSLCHRFYLQWWWEKQKTHKSNHTQTPTLLNSTLNITIIGNLQGCVQCLMFCHPSPLHVHPARTGGLQNYFHFLCHKFIELFRAVISDFGTYS